MTISQRPTPPSYEVPKAIRFGSLAVGFLVLVVFPLVFNNPTLSTIGVYAMIFLMAVTGWNIFSGYTGYIALGHAVFFGIGQYATAMLASYWKIPPGWETFLLIPVSMILAGVAAIPIGIIILRVRKHTFIVLTIALMFIFQLFAYNLRSWTGGSQGLEVAQPSWDGSVFNLPYYYVGLFLAMVAIASSFVIRRSKFGLSLLAIRDDEDRARSLGINTRKSKLTAFVISAVFLGAAGCMYAMFVGSVYPQFSFDPAFDLELSIMAFAGGLGTILGPSLGALIISGAQQYFLISFGGANVFLIVYGALFIAILRFLPGGVVPAIAEKWRSHVVRKEQRILDAEIQGPAKAGASK
jgi:branched-chain amino acid transport system permease protein